MKSSTKKHEMFFGSYTNNVLENLSISCDPFNIDVVIYVYSIHGWYIAAKVRKIGFVRYFSTYITAVVIFEVDAKKWDRSNRLRKNVHCLTLYFHNIFNSFCDIVFSSYFTAFEILCQRYLPTLQATWSFNCIAK